MTPPPAPNRSPDQVTRVAALDGIRGVAILLVMVYHFTPVLAAGEGVSRAALVFSKLAHLGNVGVDLFFVLSGFLISGILMDQKGDKGYFRNFYMRRVLRIFPLYYFILVLFIFLVPSLPGASALKGIQEARAQQFWLWTYLTNVDIALEHGYVFGRLNHFWSLAVEEQFYLMWPLVVLLFRRRRLVWVCLATILAVSVTRVVGQMLGMSYTAIYVLTVTRLDSLVIGALLAVAVRTTGGLDRYLRWIGLGAGVAVVGISVALVVSHGVNTHGVGFLVVRFSLVPMAFAALITWTIAPAGSRTLRRASEASWLRTAGKYSYAMYVLHPILLPELRRLVPDGVLRQLLHSQLAAMVVFDVAATAATLLAAVITWHLVEKRFLALKRYFVYSRPAKLAVASKPALSAAEVPQL